MPSRNNTGNTRSIMGRVSMKQKSRHNLKLLSNDEREAFLLDLLKVIEEAESTNDFHLIRECIDSWEATAELKAVPGLTERVWHRFDRLKKAGVIHG